MTLEMNSPAEKPRSIFCARKIKYTFGAIFALSGSTMLRYLSFLLIFTSLLVLPLLEGMAKGPRKTFEGTEVAKVSDTYVLSAFWNTIAFWRPDSRTQAMNRNSSMLYLSGTPPRALQVVETSQNVREPENFATQGMKNLPSERSDGSPAPVLLSFSGFRELLNQVEQEADESRQLPAHSGVEPVGNPSVDAEGTGASASTPGPAAPRPGTARTPWPVS